MDEHAGVRPPASDEAGEATVDGGNTPPGLDKGDGKNSPGVVIRGEGRTVKGSSHGGALRIIPVAKAKDMEKTLPKHHSGSSHDANFLLACPGKEKCRSSFDMAGDCRDRWPGYC